MGLRFKMKKRYKRLMFNLSAAENPLFLAYYRRLYKPKPGTTDEFLDSWSRERSGVNFLQIGANDGFIQDPLHKFIKRDHWQGVMLEPQPDVYNNFLVRLHRKRPEIKLLNAALDLEDGTRPLYRLSVSSERWATGLSSFIREVLVEKASNPRIQKHARRQGIVLPENPDDMIIADSVPTISPGSLLKLFEGRNIDLLAIDTEGFDFEILKMLDLGRISPDLVLYEELLMDEKTASDCRTYLEKHGYSCRTIRKDVLALKQKN